MKPRHFLDVEVRNSRVTGEGREGSVPVVARLVGILHGWLRTNPGAIALAFPRGREGDLPHPGNVVRIFAEAPDTLARVLMDLATNQRIAGYVLFRAAQEVPENFNGRWMEYRRFRIPNRKSRTQEVRARRIQVGDALPYLRLHSKSTDATFSLRIAQIEHQTPPAEKCLPDSYGLSLRTRPFALPVI